MMVPDQLQQGQEPLGRAPVQRQIRSQPTVQRLRQAGRTMEEAQGEPEGLDGGLQVGRKAFARRQGQGLPMTPRPENQRFGGGVQVLAIRRQGLFQPGQGRQQGVQMVVQVLHQGLDRSPGKLRSKARAVSTVWRAVVTAMS